MDWLKVALYSGPVAYLVLSQLRKMGMNPVLPILGLVAGIMLELWR